MIRFVFLDVDDTLLDFHKAEHIAVARAFREVGVEPTQAVLDRYSEVNKVHWEMLERGELTRSEVLVQRFAALFQELGLNADAESCQELYEEYLCIGHFFVEGAEALLRQLSGKYRLFLASNGTARVQDARLKSSGIDKYAEGVFISERVGADKPSMAFFQKCFSSIPDFDPQKAIMVGDSLTSDIRGGNNAGIKTCWFNPKGLPRKADIQPDHEIRSLNELMQILERS